MKLNDEINYPQAVNTIKTFFCADDCLMETISVEEAKVAFHIGNSTNYYVNL